MTVSLEVGGGSKSHSFSVVKPIRKKKNTKKTKKTRTQKKNTSGHVSLFVFFRVFFHHVIVCFAYEVHEIIDLCLRERKHGIDIVFTIGVHDERRRKLLYRKQTIS